jgi:hypothetical protein
MGPYAGVDYDSPYLFQLRTWSIQYLPLQRERGGVGKISPIIFCFEGCGIRISALQVGK